MGRRAATALHLALFLLGAALYVLFVIPRWWVLTGDIPGSLATAGRIAAGLPIALAALPVVLNLQRALKPDNRTPELALRLRAWSLLLHVLAGALLIAAAVTEIWLTLGTAGAWLFGVYGGAAALALLGFVTFHLAFVAERPPRAPKPPKPAKAKRERRRKRRRAKSETEAEPEPEAEPEAEVETGPTDESAEDTEEETGEDTGDAETAARPDAESEPAPDAADSEPAVVGVLGNKRPVGKNRHRLRR